MQEGKKILIWASYSLKSWNNIFQYVICCYPINPLCWVHSIVKYIRWRILACRSKCIAKYSDLCEPSSTTSLRCLCKSCWHGKLGENCYNYKKADSVTWIAKLVTLPSAIKLFDIWFSPDSRCWQPSLALGLLILFSIA